MLNNKEKLKAIQERIDAIHMDDYEFCVGEIQRILGGEIPKNSKTIEKSLRLINRCLSRQSDLNTVLSRITPDTAFYRDFLKIKKTLES